MKNKKKAKQCMEDYISFHIRLLFIKKPNVDNLRLTINIVECGDCDNTKHFIVESNIKYSFIGVRADKININNINRYVNDEIKTFTRNELEYAKGEVNLKVLVDLIYD